ncbi:Os06g0151025, partial [Oryza sativa Japonica Group]
MAVDEQVVGAPRHREAAALEPHELQRQRDALLVRQLDGPQRPVGVGEVHVGERDAGVGQDKLGPGVVARDLGDARGGVGHDAAGEGEEAGEERGQGGAHRRGHRGEPARRRRVDDDEGDVEGAEDEVEVGDGEHGGEARRRVGRPDQRPGGDLDAEAAERRRRRRHGARGDAAEYSE